MKQIAITSCCFLGLLLQITSGSPTNVNVQAANLSSSVEPLRSSGYAADGGKIESKYDGFKNETVVTLKKMSVTCGGGKGLASTLNETCVSFAVSLHCPGVQLEFVRYAKLQLIFETKHWDRRHPLDERELFVVADGERLKLGTMALLGQDLDTTKLIDVMREVLEVSLPYKTFDKIARAQTVEMRVGKTTFELKEKNVAALRDLNNRVKF